MTRSLGGLMPRLSFAVLGAVLSLAFIGAAAWAQAPATPVDVSDPSITERPKLDAAKARTPDYPPTAIRAGQEGETRLRVCLDAKGRVLSSQTASSSGYDLLDQAAHDWVFQSPFFPAKAGDTPVAVCGYEFTYVWSLQQAYSPPVDSYDALPEADRPKLLSKGTQPVYPQSALARGVAGKVEMTLCIDPRGRVNGMPDAPKGDGALAAATLQMVLLSRFAPGRKDGKPIMVCGVPFEHEWKLPQ